MFRSKLPFITYFSPSHKVYFCSSTFIVVQMSRKVIYRVTQSLRKRVCVCVCVCVCVRVCVLSDGMNGFCHS
jgi:hypothetical protein